MNVKGIIFDLDGTLWDSSNQIVIAWNNVLKKGNSKINPITRNEIINCLGKTNQEIVKICFKELDEHDGIKLIDICADEEIKILNKNGGILYPNLLNILKKLSIDYKLFIVSNCQKGYIESFLKFHKLVEYFDDYECSGNTDLPKSENIKKIISRNNINNVVYVGDTSGDFLACKEANIPFVYAEYGFGNVSGAKYRISNLLELPDIVNKISKNEI